MVRKLESSDGVNRSILDSWSEVQQASIELYRFDEILAEFCNIVEKELNFDLVAIQLVRRDERIIETIHGSGLAREWTGKARHNLDELAKLRDIQTDIAVANPARAETISGWDDRFDDWIYDTYNHKNLVRFFAPLILVRNQNFELIDRWWELFHWHYGDEFIKEGKRRKAAGKIREYVLELPVYMDFEIIGTVEIGYNDPQKKIAPHHAIELLNLVSSWTLKMHKALLLYVLQRIVENAIKIIKGDSASLHFQEIAKESRYVYEVGAGNIPKDFLKKYPPREGKMGKTALKKEKVLIIPDPSRGQDECYLKEYNPAVYELGIRTMVAFPLLVDEREKGVLYIHFREFRSFAASEIERIKLFANQVCAVIRSATVYTQMRDRARQLKTMHSIVQSLVSRQEQGELLYQIAWSTLNMTGSDIVTIYEYKENDYSPIERRFKTPPAVAGRFIDDSKMRTELFSEDAPVLLIENRADIYIKDDPVGDQIFDKPGRKRDKEPFVKREEIKSAAGVLLKVRSEIVGVMFINYRRHHFFSDEEREIIQTLSSSAAIAIENRRELSRTQETLMTITHQLEYPLYSIISTLSHDFMEELPEEVSHQIEKAKAWAEAAFAMCNGTVMCFGKEVGQETYLKEEEVDVQTEIKLLRELFEITNKPHNLRFPLYINPEFPLVKIDRQIFINVMYSLIHNATKYSDPKSEVTIRCLVKPDEKLISVKTQGEPIEDDEKELIFEKFRRGKVVEKTGRHHSGVGLGLWVARELMRSIGGDVRVQTDVNDRRISEFIVSLPP